VKTTGILFEKSLIEKVIKTEGKCPVTGSSLTEEDILPIKATKLAPPRNSAPTSVPGLLYALQQEWDEHVLESFALKQQLEATRKELAHALYQHDAACRVIARLMRERDEAQQLLRQFQISGPTPSVANAAPSSAPEAMDVSEQEADMPELGVGESVLGELNTICKSLSSGRKTRKVSEHLQSKELMSTIQEVATYFPHQQGQILSLAVKNTESSSTILTGGSDKSLMVMDIGGTISCKINGHKGKVTHVSFAPNQDSSLLFSAGDDNSVKVWAPNQGGGYNEKWSFSKFNAAVKGFTVHPSGNIFHFSHFRSNFLLIVFLVCSELHCIN
jgi:pre-mRNA-processing factor 19